MDHQETPATPPVEHRSWGPPHPTLPPPVPTASPESFAAVRSRIWNPPGWLESEGDGPDSEADMVTSVVTASSEAVTTGRILTPGGPLPLRPAVAERLGSPVRRALPTELVAAVGTPAPVLPLTPSRTALSNAEVTELHTRIAAPMVPLASEPPTGPIEFPTQEVPIAAGPTTQQVPVQRSDASDTLQSVGEAGSDGYAIAIPDAPEPSGRTRWADRSHIGGIRAFLVFLVATLAYGITAWRLGHTKTPDMAYWDQLADSFRHGRLHLSDPSSTHDLTQHDGKWFVPFPPLPGLLLVPWALISSVLKVNTVAFSVILGALNVALVDALLRTMRRRGVARLSDATVISLVVMWAFGTVHWYMAVAGTVWFVSQIAAATFLLLALWSAAAGRRLLAGVALGLAALGRPTMLLALPAVVALAAMANPHPDGKRRWPQALSMITLPAGLIAAGLLWYNKARFGSPTDFGYTAQNVARELAPDLRNHGQFNLRYIPRNLWSMLGAGPVKDPRSWTIKPDGQGMSMFLTTPVWIFAFFANSRERLARWCWLSVVLLIVPLIAYYNTGWYQFGYRFALDFMPVLMVLLALGLDRYHANFGRVLPKVLIVAGIAVNLWGTIWFK